MEKGFWLFKNSWGTASFGVENPYGAGYGWLSYRYVDEYGFRGRRGLPCCSYARARCALKSASSSARVATSSLRAAAPISTRTVESLRPSSYAISLFERPARRAADHLTLARSECLGALCDGRVLTATMKRFAVVLERIEEGEPRHRRECATYRQRRRDRGRVASRAHAPWPHGLAQLLAILVERASPSA
jgi:hypothetical protein